MGCGHLLAQRVPKCVLLLCVGLVSCVGLVFLCGITAQSMGVHVSELVSRITAGSSFRRQLRGRHDHLVSAARRDNGSVFILLGDSIDREFVKSRCKDPLEWEHKMWRCWDGRNTWANVMTFGTGARGCWHITGESGLDVSAYNVTLRVEKYLGKLMETVTTERIYVQLHAGLWDVTAFHGCDESELKDILHSGAWISHVRQTLIRPVRKLLQPYRDRGARINLGWRTMPFVCCTHPPLETYQLASTMGVQLACSEGLQLVDWRTVSCSALTSSMLGSDLIHWNSSLSQELFAAELWYPRFRDPCSAVMPSVEDCEKLKCARTSMCF